MPIIPISGSAVARGALVPLGSVVISSPTSIVFSSIPQGYQDLLLSTSLRNTSANSGVGAPTITFNSISSGYSTTQMFGNGAQTSSGRVTNNTATYNAVYAADGAGLPNVFGASQVDILSYSTTTRWKTIISKTNLDLIGAGQSGIVINLLANTAAINTITINGPFAAGSTATLYGVRSIGQ
jgi:hypothetical protein